MFWRQWHSGVDCLVINSAGSPEVDRAGLSLQDQAEALRLALSQSGRDRAQSVRHASAL